LFIVQLEEKLKIKKTYFWSIYEAAFGDIYELLLLDGLIVSETDKLTDYVGSFSGVRHLLS